MDSNEKYVSVSLSEDYWRELHALLDFELTNSAKALCIAKKQKNEHLFRFYVDKLAFLSVCMDEIHVSLIYGNKDL